MLPAIRNCSCKTAQTFANQQANTWIVTRDFLHDLLGPIAAIVIDYNQFIVDAKWVKAGANAREQRGKIARFA